MSERLRSPIDADRVVLTPLRLSDAEEMVETLSSPELYAYIGGEPPKLDTMRRRYSDIVVGHSPDGGEEWLNWIVRLKAAMKVRSARCRRPSCTKAVEPKWPGSSALTGRDTDTVLRPPLRWFMHWSRLACRM